MMYIKNNILLLILFYIINTNMGNYYANNNVYVDGLSTINLNANTLNMKDSSKEIYCYFTMCKKKFSNIYSKALSYRFIVIITTIYFFIANYYEKIAKRIRLSDFYFFFTDVGSDELPVLLEKINNTGDFDFIVKMRKIKYDIDFLFNYRYLIYFFIAFPFFHDNLKKVMFNIVSLHNGMKMLNNIMTEK